MRNAKRLTYLLACGTCLWLLAGSIPQAGAQAKPARDREDLPDLPDVVRSAIGVTRQGTAIECLIALDDLNLGTPKTRLLLVGALDGDLPAYEASLAVLRWFHTSEAAQGHRDRYTLAAVPCGNPDGMRLGVGPENGAGGRPGRGYPPPGDAYHSPTDPEAAYLWRWIGMHAPDLVIEIGAGEEAWQIPGTFPTALAARLTPQLPLAAENDLVTQLGRLSPAETGPVPAIRLLTTPERAVAGMEQLLAALAALPLGPSPARRELQARVRRTPDEVARQVSRHYGQELKEVVYIPAVALIGRLRLGELDDDDQHLAAVQRIVLPYVSGEKSTTPTSGSGLSGHLVFSELARQTDGPRRERFVELARVAADLAFDEDGQPLSLPPFHSEMSDAVFMGGPILASVGRLTGEARYFDACAVQVASLQRMLVRDDGLYRHSPLDDAAWGRGNGFPALGLAMILDEFPQDHPARADLLAAFRSHLRALASHQDPTGCWHQVVDRPESYRELSCTCMITYAMSRGVRAGWLEPETYQPVIDRAWHAIRTRVTAEGRLVDVCTGTGKQKSLRDYYDRTAILGPDPRGGAMALLVATELAASLK